MIYSDIHQGTCQIEYLLCHIFVKKHQSVEPCDVTESIPKLIRNPASCNRIVVDINHSCIQIKLMICKIVMKHQNHCSMHQ